MKLEPMLAAPMRDDATLAEVVGSARWSLERKWDGIRVLLDHDSETRTRLLTRTGRDVAGKFPEVVQAAKAYGGQRIILDGELTFMDPTLRLPALVGRANGRNVRGPVAAPAVFNAFDVLAVGQEDLTGWDLERRRMVLVTAVDGPSREHLVRVRPVEDKVTAWEQGRAQGWEGLVAKRLDSPYRAGARSDLWLKRKYRYELRVLAYELVPGSGSGYGSVKVGVLNGDDRLVPVGTVGSGLAERHMRSLISELGYGRPSLIVISCMGRTAGGLREPVFLRFSAGTTAPAVQLEDLPTF